ncbi:hypothetical protein MP228_004484 [Amoeboaphelidium protococcarum]|nr:hypothetical protein MP228_004484 [Amoeboaphelidium protococcarum]
MQDKKKLVLFLHGLNLPSQADAQNELVHAQLKRYLQYDFEYESINYASIIESKQLARIDRLKQFWNRYDQSTNYKQSLFGILWFTVLVCLASLYNSILQFAKLKGFSKIYAQDIQISWILRILPLRVLNLGLSFWGDLDFRFKVLEAVQDAVFRLRSKMSTGESDKFEQVELIFIGFSMGATIFMEYIYETLTIDYRLRPKFLQIDTLAGCKIKLITMGSALHWHHSSSPYRFLAQLQKEGATNRLCEVEWINLRYWTDVLSSGSWKRTFNDDNDNYNVGDEQYKNQYSKQLSSVKVNDICIDMFGNVRNSSSTRGIYSLLRIMVDNMVQVLPLLVRGQMMSGLQQMVVTFCRYTPLSHGFYFRDQKMIQYLARIIDDDNVLVLKHNKPANDGVNRAAVKEIANQAPKTDIVKIRKIKEWSPAHFTKNTVILYVHGMSNKQHIKSELDAILGRLNDYTNNDRKVTLYSISYGHLLKPGRSLSQKHLSMDQQMSSLISRLYFNLKCAVLTRFPVAMSIWSESHVREAVQEALAQKLSEIFPPNNLLLEQVDEVVLLTLSTGALVGLSGLERYLMQHQQQQQKSLAHKLRIVTLASPLPWFACSEQFTQYMPNVIEMTKTMQRAKWVNILYRYDPMSIPHSIERGLADSVTDVVLNRTIQLSLLHPIKSLLSVIGWNELTASITTEYLQDSKVWHHILNQ